MHKVAKIWLDLIVIVVIVVVLVTPVLLLYTFNLQCTVQYVRKVLGITFNFYL